MFVSKVLRRDVRGRGVLKIDHKYYLTDHGMRESCGFSNTASIDQILENIVYNELRYRGFDVTVGKSGRNEIDFVASDGTRLEYYQVSYLLASDGRTRIPFPDVGRRQLSQICAVHGHRGHEQGRGDSQEHRGLASRKMTLRSRMIGRNNGTSLILR